MSDEEIAGVDFQSAILATERAVRNGRLQLVPPVDMEDFENIEYDRDGNIIPITVGERVRSIALGYITAHPDDWNYLSTELPKP